MTIPYLSSFAGCVSLVRDHVRLRFVVRVEQNVDVAVDPPLQSMNRSNAGQTTEPTGRISEGLARRDPHFDGEFQEVRHINIDSTRGGAVLDSSFDIGGFWYCLETLFRRAEVTEFRGESGLLGLIFHAGPTLNVFQVRKDSLDKQKNNIDHSPFGGNGVFSSTLSRSGNSARRSLSPASSAVSHLRIAFVSTGFCNSLKRFL